MPDRAIASPVAVALLLLVVVAAAGILAAGVLGLAETPDSPQSVVLSAGVSPSGEVTLAHRGGPTLDVRDLDVRVAVDDEPLAHQPPVPFFSARGFGPGPTGPFNSASDSRWSVGESASFVVAATNEPQVRPGATVTIELRRNGRSVGRATAMVQHGTEPRVEPAPLGGLDRPPPHAA